MVERPVDPKNADHPLHGAAGPSKEIDMFRTLIASLLATLSFAAFAAVDVNTATQAELEALRGVGTTLSTRVLAEREKGKFKDWADLIQRVRGVGAGSATRLSEAGLTVAQKPYVRESGR